MPEKTTALASPETVKRAYEILKSPLFFRYFLEALEASGLVGEERNALVLLIVIVSRLLKRPLNAIVRGVSSAGKNFLISMILRFLPARSKREIDSSSDRAWNYAGDSFRNVVVYIRERNKITGSVHPMRTLISEGQIIHQVTEWEGGQRILRTYKVEGPVACISTTNRDLEIDDQTRHISLFMDESQEQTLRIAKAASRDSKGLAQSDLRVWRQIHSLIAARANINVALPPWFEQIAGKVFIGDITIRRYFPAFVSACQTVCLIRSFQREDWSNESGTIVVDFTDFAITALLFEDVFVESMRCQEDSATEIAEEVRSISIRMGGIPVGADDVARALNIEVQFAYKKLAKAAEAGTISRANEPEKNNRKLFLPTPRPRFVPDPEELFQAIKDAGDQIRFVHPLTGERVVYTRSRKTA